MKHIDIWYAIEQFAAEHGMSCSKMARVCGLDATTFNKSKRYSRYGQPRWPSLGTIAKMLDATHASIHDFVRLIPDSGNDSDVETNQTE